MPIYETDSAQQIAHILADADVRIVITATTQQVELVESVRTEGVHMFLPLISAERVLTEYARAHVEQVRAYQRRDARATRLRRSFTRRARTGALRVSSYALNFISTDAAGLRLPACPHRRLGVALCLLPVAHARGDQRTACFAGCGITAFSPDTRTWSTTSRRSGRQCSLLSCAS